MLLVMDSTFDDMQIIDQKLCEIKNLEDLSLKLECNSGELDLRAFKVFNSLLCFLLGRFMVMRDKKVWERTGDIVIWIDYEAYDLRLRTDELRRVRRLRRPPRILDDGGMRRDGVLSRVIWHAQGKRKRGKLQRKDE